MLRAIWLLATVIEFVSAVAMVVQDKPVLAILFGTAAGLMLVHGPAQD